MTESRRVLLALGALLLMPLAHGAANPCAIPALSAISEGLGGTGRPLDEGLSGTGHALEGLGGTGRRLAGVGAGGMGGTGHREDGFGGTGDRVAGVRDGFGGTGHAPGSGLGGTGAPRRVMIRGMVTGFASVCVNGLEVQYDQATRVRVDGRPAGTGALAVGQIVDIEARLGPAGLSAERLDVAHSLAGRVQRIDAAAGQIQIAGRTVQLPSAAGFGADISSLRPGQAVLVSGLARPDGVIQATRIDPVSAPPVLPETPTAPPRGERAVVQGIVEQVSGNTVKLVDMPPVRMAEPVAAQPGELVTLLMDTEDDTPVGERLAVQELEDLHEIVGHPEPVEVEDPHAEDGHGAPSHQGPDTDGHAEVSEDAAREEDLAHGEAEGVEVEAPEPPDGADDASPKTPDVPEAPDVPETPDPPDVPEPPEADGAGD